MTVGGSPTPPPDLMSRVAPLDPGPDAVDRYEIAGRGIKDFIVSWLPEGWSLEGKRVLDFGCGAGRVLRHFREDAERGEFWGSDIDEASVHWLNEHLSPPLHGILHGEEPPIPASSGHFDLIYAMSVFTHITDEWSAWVVEMHRLLAPQGLLLATFLGEGMIGALLGERWSDDRIGINFSRCGTRWDQGGPNAFVSPWWLRAHWGRAFDVLRLERSVYDSGDRRGLHDAALLRRRDVSITREELERPEADEPRELRAAQHNVRQLGRELADVHERLYREIEQNRRLSEKLEHTRRHWQETAEWWEDRADTVLQSRLWRATKPLRWLRSRIRLTQS
jgi:SAM-dependent methyltransferase